MPKVSVITAVHSDGGGYLLDAYKSLQDQVLPEGWEWEWCLQEDGDTGLIESSLPSDPRILPGTGLHGRAAVARTMALSRATGGIIRTFDADDMLLPGALARDIDCLERVAWCASACVDLLPDGSIRPGPYDPPPGVVTRGRFYAEQRRDRLSVKAATFAAHTDLVRTLGGWPALTGAETIGLLLAAEAVSVGEFIAEPSLIYRKHEAQTTAAKRYWAEAEAKARIASVLAHADALRRSGWTWSL